MKPENEGLVYNVYFEWDGSGDWYEIKADSIEDARECFIHYVIGNGYSCWNISHGDLETTKNPIFEIQSEDNEEYESEYFIPVKFFTDGFSAKNEKLERIVKM